MTFKFDELNIERQFREKLDEFLPGVLLMRPNRSKKIENHEVANRTIVTDKLIIQNNKDALKMIMRQIAHFMAIGVAKSIGSTHVSFIPRSMKFEYEEGEFEHNGNIHKGTQVLTTVLLKK